MPIDLDKLRNRTTRQSVLGGHGLDVVNMHGSDFDALIAELRTLRARVAELERDLDACRVELLEARHTVGEGWFAGGVTLAEAIERKCRSLEGLGKDEAEPEPKSVEEPTEWAWYYDGSSVQGDGFATREEAIRDAVIGHGAERFLVGPMREIEIAEWVDAADIVERISESLWDNLGIEDIRVYAAPAAQAALEAWARNNLSPDPSRYCEGEPVKMEEVRSALKGGSDG